MFCNNAANVVKIRERWQSCDNDLSQLCLPVHTNLFWQFAFSIHREGKWQVFSFKSSIILDLSSKKWKKILILQHDYFHKILQIYTVNIPLRCEVWARGLDRINMLYSWKRYYNTVGSWFLEPLISQIFWWFRSKVISLGFFVTDCNFTPVISNSLFLRPILFPL